MRRADRLFQIVQLLRGRRLTTAAWLAERLQISERTVYRDIRDLSLSGVPIESEAGIGYRLKKTYDLPPLMFNVDEINALVLGARIVANNGGKMRLAAESALSKIDSVLPKEQKAQLDNVKMFAPDFVCKPQGQLIDLIHQCIQNQQQLLIGYQKEQQTAIEKRLVYPLGLFYWGNKWTMVAWCTLRDDFRHFRLDRIQTREITGQYRLSPHQQLSVFLQRMIDFKQ